MRQPNGLIKFNLGSSLVIVPKGIVQRVTFVLLFECKTLNSNFKMGYLLQNDGCYSTSTISSASNPSGRRNGTCFTTHGMYYRLYRVSISDFFSKYCRNQRVPLPTVSIILKYPNVHMKLQLGSLHCMS